MAGQQVQCDDCGRRYTSQAAERAFPAGDQGPREASRQPTPHAPVQPPDLTLETPAGSYAEVAAEIRKLRILLARLFVGRIVYNLILLLLGSLLFFWFFHRAEVVPNDLNKELKQLQDLLKLQP
jgi:hypothetical protein